MIENLGTDAIVSTRYEAHDALDGHRPIALIGEGIVPYVACVCNPSQTRPYNWHIVDLLAEAARN